MITDVKTFADSAKGFSKNPLGIIALFIVLVYGFATLSIATGKNIEGYIGPMVYFLIIFPLIVFLGFLWLVSKHSDKIYGPSDFKDDAKFLEYKEKAKIYSAVSLTAATIKQLEGNLKSNLNSQDMETIVELVSKTDFERKVISKRDGERRILWVDDNPDNNLYERKAFEAQGIAIDIVRSTDEAIDRLRNFKYSIIISDMGRREGQKEGYVLLKKIIESGDSTPYFIYAGSDDPAHRMMALQSGAQGSTNKANELFKMVMDSISNA